MLGFDRSFALLTPQDAHDHVAHGLVVLEQCLWDGLQQPANRVINMRNMLDAGGRILGYISPSETFPDSVERARVGIPDDIWAALERVAVDIEEVNIGANFVKALGDVEALGKRRDLYTNPNTWFKLGNPQWPDRCGCWNATWSTDMSRMMPIPYGGLAEGDPRIWGRQYGNGSDEDLDIFLLDAPVPPPPPPPGRHIVDGIGVHFADGTTERVWPRG